MNDELDLPSDKSILAQRNRDENVKRRVPIEGKLYCMGHLDWRPAIEFRVLQVREDGSKRWSPRCRACVKAALSTSATRLTVDQIMSVEAPLRAANRLLRDNPEVLALIVQRYRVQYLPYLEEERERLVAIKKAQQTKRRIRDKKKKNEKVI